MYEIITYYSVLCLAVLSALLVVGLLSFSCCVKERTTTIFFLIINLLVVNTFHAVAYIINLMVNETLIYGKNEDSNILCQIQAVIMIFTSMSQEFWVSSITFIFYKININEDYCQNKKRNVYRIYYFCCFTILPLILTLLFYKLKSLGKNKLYCWVKQPIDFNDSFCV